jgi:hypothetical protein
MVKNGNFSKAFSREGPKISLRTDTMADYKNYISKR